MRTKASGWVEVAPQTQRKREVNYGAFWQKNNPAAIRFAYQGAQP
jgi:hypothetical protein